MKWAVVGAACLLLIMGWMLRMSGLLQQTPVLSTWFGSPSSVKPSPQARGDDPRTLLSSNAPKTSAKHGAAPPHGPSRASAGAATTPSSTNGGLFTAAWERFRRWFLEEPAPGETAVSPTAAHTPTPPLPPTAAPLELHGISWHGTRSVAFVSHQPVHVQDIVNGYVVDAMTPSSIELVGHGERVVLYTDGTREVIHAANASAKPQ